MTESDGPFAVIISDHNMPGMDGIEFLQESKIFSEDSVRLMLTGCSAQETAMHAINACGVFRFITKPFRPIDVLENV